MLSEAVLSCRPFWTSYTTVTSYFYFGTFLNYDYGNDCANDFGNYCANDCEDNCANECGNDCDYDCGDDCANYFGDDCANDNESVRHIPAVAVFLIL